VAFGENSSAFWFHGRIHPTPRVHAFYAEEIHVEEDVTLEIICEGISVWARPGTNLGRRPIFDRFFIPCSPPCLLVGRGPFSSP
jgi:hypothetical protein